MWNSVLAGGLSSSILVLRSGMSTVAKYVVSGGVYLRMFAGAIYLLNNYVHRPMHKASMESSGMNGSDVLYE